MSRVLLACALGSLLALGACGEKVQTTAVGGERKADAKSWDANNSPYLAPGWTPGTPASWEAQLRARAQTQNDYAAGR
jgi:hypothetical protein